MCLARKGTLWARLGRERVKKKTEREMARNKNFRWKINRAGRGFTQSHRAKGMKKSRKKEKGEGKSDKPHHSTVRQKKHQPKKLKDPCPKSCEGRNNYSSQLYTGKKKREDMYGEQE